eukprot:gene9242-1328_t
MNLESFEGFFKGSIKDKLVTSNVQFILDSDDCGWILLNSDNKSVNFMTAQFIQDLHDVLNIVDKYINDKTLKILVFYSLKKSFMVGADVKLLYPITDAKALIDISRSGQRLFDRVNAIRIPTVAAIKGNALGAGLELCLACTYRVSCSSKKTKLGLPEAKLGFVPGCGGTIRLPKIIGLSNSLQIILSGNSVNPESAKKLGLVDRIFEIKDDYNFFDCVRSYANSLSKSRKQVKTLTFREKLFNDNWIGRYFVYKMALKDLNKKTKGKYPAPYYALETVLNSFTETPSAALDFEALAFSKMSISPESKNLVSGFIMNENKKKLPKELPTPKEVKSISIIGAGIMGSGIAQICAENDYHVYMKDIKDAFVNKGMKKIKSTFEDLQKKNKLTSTEVQKKLNLVQHGIKYQNVKNSDLIIEAASEKLDIKKKIIEELEMNISSGTIIATNTSTLSIQEIARDSKKSKNIVGMHFFNPVKKMSLVEIIKTTETSEEAISTVYQLALKLGKTPIIVKDSPGFVVNRILGVYLCEAGRLLKEGGSVKVIDDCFVEFGMPIGPFRLLDEIGLDIALDSITSLQTLGEQFTPIQGMDYLVEKGIKGRKSGKGFYVYNQKDDKTKMTISPEIIKIFGKPTKKQFSEDIIDRCILLMIREASNILDEGIVSSPEDVDLALLLGIGFPPVRGGLLSYCDNRSVKNIVVKLKSLMKQYGKRFEPSGLLQEMAKENLKFFPERPNIPYVERRGPPIVRLEGCVRARL